MILSIGLQLSKFFPLLILLNKYSRGDHFLNNPVLNPPAYDASVSEVFWKNFLAGVDRSMGSIIFYLIYYSDCKLNFNPILDPDYFSDNG